MTNSKSIKEVNVVDAVTITASSAANTDGITATVTYIDPYTVTKPAKTREVPLDTYREHAECACGGEFKSTGQGVTQRHTKWQHRCDSCGTVAWFDRNYPGIVYRPAK